MPRFPALEPEPAPLSPWARARRGVVVLVAVAAAVSLAVVLPAAIGGADGGNASRPTASPLPTLSGQVVVIDGQHLALTDPRGKLVRPLTGDLRIDPQVATLVPDPSLERAVTGPGFFGPPTGQLVRLRAQTSTAVSAVPADLLRRGGLADEPWTDNGKALVLVSGDRLEQVGVVDIASGRLAPLGTAAAVAGIPDNRGVVVATGGALLPQQDGVFPVQTSTRIELRSPGRPPTVLKQLRELAREAHLAPDEPLVVDRLSVSRDGRYVLVGYDRAASHEYPDGPANRPRVEPAGVLVVLDLQGQVKGIRPATPGRRLDWVRWSGTDVLAVGESKTTDTINTDERVLSVWDRIAAPAAVELPGAFENTLLSPCVWSPRADHLLCGDDRGWYDVDVATRRARAITGVTGRPVIWLP